MELEDILRKIIEEECEDYFFGVADLSPAKKSLFKEEESVLAEYPKAISVGITMPPTIQLRSLRKDESSTTKYNDYDRIIRQLNLIMAHLSNLLQIKGYKALSMHIEELYTQKICDEFSNELVANMAGLGRIGNNGLLITPEVGSSVLWGTVLTDAPLKVTE